MTGIALDRRTGDLYVSRVAPNPTSIDRVTPDGTRSVFAANVRPEGLAIALGRKLIATIQRRPTSNSPMVNQVVSFHLGTGDETILASGVGTLIGAVAVSETGEIFVSDHKDGKIRRLRPDGAGGYRLSVFASGFSTSSRRYPPDLAPHFGLSFNHLVFGSRGRLYVSDYGAGRIYAIEGPS